VIVKKGERILGPRGELGYFRGIEKKKKGVRVVEKRR